MSQGRKFGPRNNKSSHLLSTYYMQSSGWRYLWASVYLLYTKANMLGQGNCYTYIKKIKR